MAKKKKNPFAKFAKDEKSQSINSKFQIPEFAVNGKKHIRAVTNGQFITRSMTKKGFEIDAHCFQEEKDSFNQIDEENSTIELGNRTES